MFFEILFLALLFAVILVRVLISIKMATEHVVAHWNQVAVINEVTSNTSGINNVTSGNFGITNGVSLRRSARIQALNLKENTKEYK
jgi:hypothetical protein